MGLVAEATLDRLKFQTAVVALATTAAAQTME
jgi:hypothetical protein